MNNKRTKCIQVAEGLFSLYWVRCAHSGSLIHMSEGRVCELYTGLINLGAREFGFSGESGSELQLQVGEPGWEGGWVGGRLGGREASDS